MSAKVAIIMGSQSDWPTMKEAADLLETLGVAHEVRIVSAHRTPDRLWDYGKTAVDRGLQVIIAGAGGAAHLPGMMASKTRVPVIGVPVQTRALSGVDSLYSILQMPRGYPVATMAIGAPGAKNAGLMAAGILALQDAGLAQRLDTENLTLSTTVFQDFSYDISNMVKTDESRPRNIRAIPTGELLTGQAAIVEKENYSEGQLVEELHQRFARAAICVAVALIGFSTLMLGTFSRFGVWRQAGIAFLLLILLEGLRGVVSEPVLAAPHLWPLLYLPTVLGLAVSALFLRFASRPLPRLLPRRRTEPAT